MRIDAHSSKLCTNEMRSLSFKPKQLEPIADALEYKTASLGIQESKQLENTIQHHFDSTTQFIFEGGSITLRQGAIDIASSQFSDWLQLFQAVEQSDKHDIEIQISKTMEGIWDSYSRSMVIRNPSVMGHHLSVYQKDLPHLEQRLTELHQGCCEPVQFNLVADISQKPDDVLRMLQDITNFELSSEQIWVAKESIAEFPTELEINILDLYQAWKPIPTLSFFAKALRFYFLSA